MTRDVLFFYSIAAARRSFSLHLLHTAFHALYTCGARLPSNSLASATLLLRLTYGETLSDGAH